MNHILWQQQRIETLEAQIKQIAEEIQQFRAHLASEKFTGTEVIAWCPRCQKQPTKYFYGISVGHCGDCRDGRIEYREERKDWIATSDVNRWLDGLQSVVRE